MRILLALAFGQSTVACGTGPSSVASGPPTLNASRSTADVGAPEPRTFAAEEAGLRLVATLDKTAVEPGETVTAHLTLTNDRLSPTTFLEPCDSTVMTVQLPTPLDPAGRTWTGVKGAFKDYALTESQGTPAESSIRNPPPTNGKPGPCHATATDPALTSVGGATLAPGDTYETDVIWTASLVRDLPSIAGVMPFSIGVQDDFESAGHGLYRANTLKVDGTITVLPGGPTPVSAGQALDAALGDKVFATWLAKHPRTSWANSNLFLQPGAIDVKALPSVPYWDVELYAAPRSWVIVYVDASTATVLRHMVCNHPCSR